MPAAQVARPTPASKNVFEAWTKESLARWSPASFPTGDGGTWTWAEPGVAPKIVDGRLELAVPKFTRKHDQVQIFDNPKHLLACRDPILVPESGVVVETTLAAALHNAKSTEWGEGFAALNLMDFQNGLVLDGLASGTRTAILFERLQIPGMIPPEQAFTAIADGPRSAKPLEEHRFRFQYEPKARRIQGWIDDQPVLDYRNVPFRIAQFTPGAGLITLRYIENGKSVSLRGQGATGRWGPIQVR